MPDTESDGSAGQRSANYEWLLRNSGLPRHSHDEAGPRSKDGIHNSADRQPLAERVCCAQRHAWFLSWQTPNDATRMKSMAT